MNYLLHKKKIVACYFISYYLCILFLAYNHMLLWQYRPIFFTYSRDLPELFIIATGLPKFMISHPWAFLVSDILLFAVPLMLLIYFFKKGKFSPPIGILFTLYTGLYFLIANIFLQYHEEPYLVYFVFSFLFIVNREDKFYSILSLCRFYFLYIFFSAAIWKIFRGAVFNLPEMSNILIFQHNDVLNTDCHSFFCRVCYYLIDHPAVSYLFYAAGVLLEVFFSCWSFYGPVRPAVIFAGSRFFYI